VFAALFCLLLVFGYDRARNSLASVVAGSHDIYLQQYQMTEFFRKNPHYSIVGVNDIGLISFATAANVIDLAGLGNQFVSEQLLLSDYTQEDLNYLTNNQNIQVVVVYEGWFIDHQIFSSAIQAFPSTWKKVESWSIPHTTVVWGNEISFFATQFIDEVQLRQDLDRFAAQLPSQVQRKKY
jgi:hypothetical protein